jgi:lipoprotein-anchoring transpeptidase ErfK/SrfK
MRHAYILSIVGPRKTTKKDNSRAKLEKELRAAIGEIDEKGLLFLLHQAQVLIHNARVQSMEGNLNQGEPHTAIKGAVSTNQDESVRIEDMGEGKAIFLTIGRARKVLTPEEMRRLVRICYGAETKSEALRHLFTVLVKERKDILTDAMIGSPDSPLLTELFSAVRTAYRLEDR